MAFIGIVIIFIRSHITPLLRAFLLTSCLRPLMKFRLIILYRDACSRAQSDTESEQQP